MQWSLNPSTSAIQNDGGHSGPRRRRTSSEKTHAGKGVRVNIPASGIGESVTESVKNETRRGMIEHCSAHLVTMFVG
jgi:hypothetical protein